MITHFRKALKTCSKLIWASYIRCFPAVMCIMLLAGLVTCPARAADLERLLPKIEQMQDGSKHIISLMQRENMHYPLLRIEKRYNADGELMQQIEMAGDHVILIAKQGVVPADVEHIADIHGLKVLRRLGHTDSYLIGFDPADHEVFTAIRQTLGQEPGILAVEPDYLIELTALPNDPRLNEQWGTMKSEAGGARDTSIKAPQAWEISTGSRDVLVGVSDSGIDYLHPDLKANMWANPGESGQDEQGADKHTNGIDDDGNGFIDDWHGWDFADEDNDPIEDNSTHGTHCAGTIGAEGNNSTGIAGVNWQVSLVGIKIFSSGGRAAFVSDAVQGVDYAVTIGCDVTSASWGFRWNNPGAEVMAQALSRTMDSDLLFCASAGNNHLDNERGKQMPASLPDMNIITVAATNTQGVLTDFSNYGATSVDLGAPGDHILSTASNYYSDDPRGYVQMAGTSMATPFVAGACALLKSIRPTATAMQIKNAILRTVDPEPTLDRKTVSGGRLNLAAAAQLINEQEGSRHLAITPGEVNLTAVTNRPPTPIILNFQEPETDRASVNWWLRVETEDDVTGLMAISSTEPGGPKFVFDSFTPPSGIPAQNPTLRRQYVSGVSDDSISGPIPLNFSFPWNGTTVDKVWIGANGFVSFSEPDGPGKVNTALPDPSAPKDMIAAFWDDLSPHAGMISYWNGWDVFDQEFVIQWNNVPLAVDNLQRVSFEIHLRSDGAVICQYAYAGGSKASATIGLQYGAGERGMTYALNGGKEMTQEALAMYPCPLINASPGVSTVSWLDPGQTIDEVFSVAGMLPTGEYHADIVVHSDDDDMPVKTIPLTITVVEN